VIQRVAIAGAGIGGLTLAAALRRRGVQVAVLERAAQLRAVGAGLGLGPNAIKAFERLGLASAVLAVSAPIHRAAILDPHGRMLGPEVDGTRLQQQMGAPQVAIHRARLHDVLLAAAGPAFVRLGFTVAGYDQCEDRITITGQDGERVEADLVVGADGLHSAIRAQLLSDGDPRYAGYTAWRGVTPPGAVTPPSRMSETWGRSERFGIADIGSGEIYWFAVADARAGGADIDVNRELLARFGTWHDPIPAIISATPASRIIRTDIVDRPPITRWHEGRVVLLGDAAHPMTPNLGQGACQAIEDAVVLDQCLATEATIESALRRYEERRVPRANAIVRASRQFGAVAQWRNPLAVWFRNAVMRLTPPSAVMAQSRRLLQTDL
jgi:2-polyprenyl-6-methoxyphenol hydroxylase-like FAD-dependent oxidoreductase